VRSCLKRPGPRVDNPAMSVRAAALLSLFLAATAAQAAEPGPQAAVQAFYELRMSQLPNGGAPDAPALKLIAGMLTPRLHCLLKTAHRYDEAFLATQPGDKPPFVEGDLWSSLFEGPTRVKAQPARLGRDLAWVPVRMFFDDGGRTDATGWTDTVLLARIDGRWLIADVDYGGNFAFGNAGRLSGVLSEQLQRPDPALKWTGREVRACP